MLIGETKRLFLRHFHAADLAEAAVSVSACVVVKPRDTREECR
jgi:hypothetical protein